MGLSGKNQAVTGKATPLTDAEHFASMQAGVGEEHVVQPPSTSSPQLSAVPKHDACTPCTMLRTSIDSEGAHTAGIEQTGRNQYIVASRDCDVHRYKAGCGNAKASQFWRALHVNADRVLSGHVVKVNYCSLNLGAVCLYPSLPTYINI